MKKNIYITTAIDYANGIPHIGHAYEKLLADILSRYERLKNNIVYLSIGIDEHGLKVQKYAEINKKTVKECCKEIYLNFYKFSKIINISNNCYVRTTDIYHKNTVKYILQYLYEKGYIYKSHYKGFYSIKEEQFLQEKDQINGKWPKHFGEVINFSETNYFLKLNKYKSWLKNIIQNKRNFIYPQYFAKQIIKGLSSPLKNLCLSRPKYRLYWGIPLPFDTNYVTYVWIDALINYLSNIYSPTRFNRLWPVNYQIIGKDIIYPHLVFWIIILKMLNIKLPKHFIIHGWWLYKKEKMSKTLNNVLNPIDLIKNTNIDAFRYFMIIESKIGRDSNFLLNNYYNKYNSDLSNNLGNLITRFQNMSILYLQGNLNKLYLNIENNNEKVLKQSWEGVKYIYFKHIEKFNYSKVLENIFVFIRNINIYIEKSAPWKLFQFKRKINYMKIENILIHIASGLRLVISYLYPFMPNFCKTILYFLGIRSKIWLAKPLLWSYVFIQLSEKQKLIYFPK